jgi:hypothetical protein
MSDVSTISSSIAENKNTELQVDGKQIDGSLARPAAATCKEQMQVQKPLLTFRLKLSPYIPTLTLM